MNSATTTAVLGMYRSFWAFLMRESLIRTIMVEFCTISNIKAAALNTSLSLFGLDIGLDGLLLAKTVEDCLRIVCRRLLEFLRKELSDEWGLGLTTKAEDDDERYNNTIAITTNPIISFDFLCALQIYIQERVHNREQTIVESDRWSGSQRSKYFRRSIPAIIYLYHYHMYKER